jgi:mRNA-degrading endonuclease RelE of RelBE toxin-antitoxin system
MAKGPKFQIVFAPEALRHLDEIDSKHHTLLRRTIHEQLTHSPDKETRNRKPMEAPAPFGALWELRCGPKSRYRVFYDVEPAARMVQVLAVGVRDRNRILIGREVFES